MINNESIVRSTHLLNAVHELHKEGFQHLAVYCYFKGTNWAATLLPSYDLCIHKDEIQVLPSLSHIHRTHVSQAGSDTYFNWSDVSITNPYTLANTIKKRLGNLLAACKGDNFAYVGWFAKLLGQSENRMMPLMKKRKWLVPGTLAIHNGGSFPLPPLQRARQFNGQHFVVDHAPHIRSPSDDWHFAHKTRIDGFAENMIKRLPEYPYRLENEQEMSAYWESAVYYAHSILEVVSISDFLRKLGNSKAHNDAWKWFVKIYDSHGQLDYFVAFLIRRQMEGVSSLLPSARMNHRIKWLSAFASRTKQRQCIHSRYNPFFGANSNPLHLGLILAEFDTHWLK